ARGRVRQLARDYEPLLAPAVCLVISFIFFAISWGVGSAMWVAIIHVFPSGSTTVPTRWSRDVGCVPNWEMGLLGLKQKSCIAAGVDSGQGGVDSCQPVDLQ